MEKYLHKPILPRWREWRLGKVLREIRGRFSASALDAIPSNMHSNQYAALAYSTINIGDEIQTIAQLGFLPTTDKLKILNRDHLNDYYGERVFLIANGWYLHNQKNWSPAPSIEPIFVSFHLSDAWEPDTTALEYLRRHGPIGCRDLTTVRRLQNYDVEAYFSGCLTLTLRNPYHNRSDNRYVVMCDADLGYDGGYPPSASSLVKRLIPEHIRREAIVVRQECAERFRTNYAWKSNRALCQLELLSRARLVITTRLHCALPCRALGIPVIFLHESYDSDSRFDGLRTALNGYGPDANSIDLDWDKPEPVDIEPFRELATESTLSAIRRKLKDGSKQ